MLKYFDVVFLLGIVWKNILVARGKRMKMVMMVVMMVVFVVVIVALLLNQSF